MRRDTRTAYRSKCSHTEPIGKQKVGGAPLTKQGTIFGGEIIVLLV